MSQFEKFMAYLKSLDPHRPHLIMVKMGKFGQPEWWTDQGVVMGVAAGSVITAPSQTSPDKTPPIDNDYHLQ